MLVGFSSLTHLTVFEIHVNQLHPLDPKLLNLILLVASSTPAVVATAALYMQPSPRALAATVHAPQAHRTIACIPLR